MKFLYFKCFFLHIIRWLNLFVILLRMKANINTMDQLFSISSTTQKVVHLLHWATYILVPMVQELITVKWYQKWYFLNFCRNIDLFSQYSSKNCLSSDSLDWNFKFAFKSPGIISHYMQVSSNLKYHYGWKHSPSSSLRSPKFC